LRRLSVKSIDLVVVSHHHADHYGGMSEVIKAFRPRVFLATESLHTTPHYLWLLQFSPSAGCRRSFLRADPRRIELGWVLLTVLPQPAEDTRDENDNSIGIQVQYGSFSMLLTGDSQAREQAFWKSRVAGLIRDSTVLRLAHHGSRNGTDARWLGMVRPELAVASLGRDNEFGHPHSESIASLARLGISLRRTDRDGTVTIQSDGQRWWVVRDQLTARGPPAEQARPRSKRDSGVKRAGRINVNTASEAELESLPRIGPVIARRIIEGRPYRSIDDLDRVKGIGQKRLEEIRPFLAVE
jgi:beta-lactamase superfamily II metal-dependent hydrolase